jgi:hypothetical protein
MNDLGHRASVEDVIVKEQRFSFAERILLVAGCMSVIVLLLAALGGP